MKNGSGSLWAGSFKASFYDSDFNYFQQQLRTNMVGSQNDIKEDNITATNDEMNANEAKPSAEK